MKWTLLLAIPSLILGAVLGTFLGALAGWKSRDAGQKFETGLVLMIYCTPPYFLSLLFLYALSFKLGLFPLKGFYSTGSALDIAHHLMLPVIVMTLFSLSRNYMIMRGASSRSAGICTLPTLVPRGFMGRRSSFATSSRTPFCP